MTLAQSWAINGLGGIGKTQIVLEYAYRYRQNYRFVFWTSAATRETLLADLVNIADLLQLPERAEQDQKKVLIAVKKWLATHQEWLWILDNADDIAMVRDFVPLEQPGHLLLTSRAQALGSLAWGIEIEAMDMVESTLFLLRRAKLLTPDAFLDQVPKDQLAAAEAIVLEMGLLPLALDQAGAYIEATRCNLPDYLRLLRSSPLRLLDERGAHVDHPLSVTRTFTLAFAQLEQSNAAAAELLTACTFLAPEAIPEEFFCAGAAYLGPTFEMLDFDPFQFNSTMQTLLAYSLLQRQPNTHTLTIHRLVQAVLKEHLPEAVQRAWAARLMHAMSQISPPHRMQVDYWQGCKRLFPHALALMDLALDYQSEEDDEDTTELITLTISVAHYFWNCAQFTEAESLYQRALDTCEQTLGSGHLLVAKAVQGLANVCFAQGKYAEAEPLYQRALRIREQMFGTEHALTANTLSNLALLYTRQGKYQEAEPCYQRTLRIHEQTHGAEHPEVARSLNNLGSFIWIKASTLRRNSSFGVLCASVS
jgi:tetratricopeptide (TPR) repeat protein